MRLFRSRSCLWRDSIKLGSTPGSLLFSTEAGDGEDKGWSRTQPSRAMTQSSPIPRLRQASVRMTIIGLVCHETPHCARNFMILTTRDQGNQKKELNLVTNTCSVANNHFPSPHRYRTDAIALCPQRTIFTFHWSAARFILY